MSRRADHLRIVLERHPTVEDPRRHDDQGRIARTANERVEFFVGGTFGTVIHQNEFRSTMADEEQIPHLQMLVESADGTPGKIPHEVDLPELGQVRVRRPDDFDQIPSIVDASDEIDILDAFDHRDRVAQERDKLQPPFPDRSSACSLLLSADTPIEGLRCSPLWI